MGAALFFSSAAVKAKLLIRHLEKGLGQFGNVCFVFAATFFEFFHEVRLNSFIITFGKEAEQLLIVSLIQPFTLLLKLHLSVKKINNTE